jgi:hypothetical protein
VLAVILGLLGALTCMAFLALMAYSTYRHYNLPTTARGHDTWAGLAWLSVLGALVSGGFTIYIAEDIA